MRLRLRRVSECLWRLHIESQREDLDRFLCLPQGVCGQERRLRGGKVAARSFRDVLETRAIFGEGATCGWRYKIDKGATEKRSEASLRLLCGPSRD